ncbi:hypothetical protein AusDCA_2843 [Desulfitobacterium sp. AusDCA]
MGIKISAQISISVRSVKLKKALHNYADHHKTTITHLIEDAWSKLLAEDDPNITVKRDYTDSFRSKDDEESGGDNRRLSITVNPLLLNDVDAKIDSLKLDERYEALDRTTFTQEAIKRFIEPLLIDEGYLTQTVFKDKINAVKNLEIYRNSMGLNKQEFFNHYISFENKPIISYPQYALIIRSCAGNVDKIIRAVSSNTNIPEDIFYAPIDAFSQYYQVLQNKDKNREDMDE